MDKKKKTYYTVIVSIQSGAYAKQFCHLDVERYYKQEGMLIIKCVKKEVHKYEMKRVENIQVRGYQRGVVKWGV